MKRGGDGARHRRHRIGKVSLGQDGAQSRVLHSDLDGDRAPDDLVVAEQSGEIVAQPKPTGVEEEDRQQESGLSITGS